MSVFDHNDLPNLWPPEIGGYEVLRPLDPAGQTALAVAPGRRTVVLKTLDPDCLVRSGSKSRLHPGIRDRLARVRELAHVRVANLYGVEHDAGRTYLVWEHVEGRTLEEWATRPDVTPRDLLLAARELILTVESLHARGIIHGALHGRNVIVGGDGRLKLTHVSPLLYTDPQHDLASITDLLRDLARQRGDDADAAAPLEALADESSESGGTLRSAAARAAALIDLRREEASGEVEHREDAHRRRASRLAAAAVTLAALAASYGLHRSVRAMTPRPPLPPEAPPSALEP